ncbi:hypothetical protein EMCRGX_G023625 [Ephydatia muelleri]
MDTYNWVIITIVLVSDGWVRGWVGQGMGGSGDGWVRGWVGQGMGGSGDGWVRGWVGQGMGGSGDGWVRGWVGQGMGGSGDGWVRGWVGQGMGGSGDGWVRGWVGQGMGGSGDGWVRGWVGQGWVGQRMGGSGDGWVRGWVGQGMGGSGDGWVRGWVGLGMGGSGDGVGQGMGGSGDGDRKVEWKLLGVSGLSSLKWMMSEWNSDSILYGGTLAHLVSLGPLDEEVHALPGPADISPGRVEPRVKTTVVDSKFPDPQETKEPRGKGCPEHQMVVSFQRGLSPTSAACDPAFPESVAVMWA